MRRTSPLTALLSIVLLGLSAHAQEVTLEWKLKEGDKLYLETVTTFKQSMKSLMKDFKQEVEMTTVLSLTVQKVNEDKTVVLDEKVEYINVKNLAGGSTATPEDRYADKLRNASFKVTFDPVKGEVVKFEGYDELVKSIAGEDATAQKVVRTLLPEESLKRSVGEPLSFLPGKAVKKDDKWTRSDTLQFGPLGSLSAERTYVYEGKDTLEGKQYDKITFTADTKYSPPAKSEDSPLLFQVTKGDLKGEDYRGAIYFDAAAGRPVRMETTLRLKGNLTITVGATPTDTELVQDQTMKTRYLDKNPTPPPK